MKQNDLLTQEIEHIDIKKIDTRDLIDSMSKMSFTARETARATEIYQNMLKDKDCVNILTLAGSSSAAGCMNIYTDLVENNMIDVIVSTGASIVDMDFFEALGFKHYKGSQFIDDNILYKNRVDRIYDTFISEDDLQTCDEVIKEIADSIGSGVLSSREFIVKMGEYLSEKAVKHNSLIETAYKKGVPIFCPAFSDSSAGFGLVMHQEKNKDNHVSIDSVKDFRELTYIKIKAKETGLFMVGGGVPKNFAQDTAVAAQLLGDEEGLHKYAIQLTVADVRDGACSSSTLKEAHSWGKVDTAQEQMVFSEATLSLPLIASATYHSGVWKEREELRFNDFLFNR